MANPPGEARDAPYRVEVESRAGKEIVALPPRVRRQVGATISRLAETLGRGERPQDMARLQGGDNEYRIDGGEYRVLFWLDNRARLITIGRVRHRQDAYRAF